MSLPKTTPSEKNNFYKCKLITSKSKEEFIKEYEKYDESSAREFYQQVLLELEKAVVTGNINNFKSIIRFFDNLRKNEISHKNFFDDCQNPFKCTNIVILACKYNQAKFLKFVFKRGREFSKNFSLHAQKTVLPKEEDESCHNSFYYAIRSGNVELLYTLINWPDKYFEIQKNELDQVISKACEELKLKNVPLTDDMEISVENILINLRFLADNAKRNRKSGINVLDNIYNRIEIVCENINLLITQYSSKDIDEPFLYVTKFIAQNIHVLKRLLRSTYDRIPWEEIEFCLICFVFSYVKLQEINLFYHAILNKMKLLNYLETFVMSLEIVKSSIKEKEIYINKLPKLSRETIITEIINNHPPFEKLYKDYQQIRDIHSLEKINDYISIAITVDPNERKGQIVIIRVLQLVGEYLKNTLESPKLSNLTSELLLLSLSRDTRKVVTDLRDSFSHASSVFKRTEIEKHSDTKFFTGVQSDIKKIGNAIIDILYNSKIKVIRSLLKEITDSENSDEISEIIKALKNCRAENIISEYFKITEHEKLEKLVNEFGDSIGGMSQVEKDMFTKIGHKINFAKIKSKNRQEDYVIGLVSLKGLETLSVHNKNDHNILKGLKFSANETLKNITPQMESHSIKEIAKLSAKIFYSVRSRKYQENLDNVNKLFYEILLTCEFQTGDIKWIEEFRGKLNEEIEFTSTDKQSQIDKMNTHILLKLSELKCVLEKNLISGEAIEKNYRSDKKLQAVIEMLLLDIMSILSISNCYLENNLFSLDDNYPLLTGKCLRNHLAHDNILFEMMLSNPSTAVILNAKKFVEEDILATKKRIGNSTIDDPLKLREKHSHNLKIITCQRKMFTSLEEGNLEIAKDCLRKGADINARSIDLWTSLHFAAKGSNIEALKFILTQNISVTVKDQNGQSPLHIAVFYGNLSIVDFLIKEEADIHDIDNFLRTPLHIAAQRGHTDIVELLLKSNADFILKDQNDMLPLHYAIRNDHIEIVKILLEKDVNMNINESLGGFAPLHIAAEFGNLEIVNLLLQNGADVNAKSDRNYTPLHAAAFNGHLNVVNILILANADINATVIGGGTPLHYALEKGHEEIANVFLGHGAKVNVRDKAYNYTPLHYASKAGAIETVQILLKYGADASASNVEGSTPLHLAAHSGHLEIITILLNHGVNINAKDNNDVTPLHYATDNNQKDVVEFLIRNQAKINLKDHMGCTSLYIAALKGYKEIMNLLLKTTADVSKRNVHGNTVLHAAAINGSKDITDMLIKHKVEVNIRNNEDITPLHLAAVNGHDNLIMTLIENGAKINAKDIVGLTPLHAAVIAGCQNSVNILIRNKADVNTENIKGHTCLYSAVEVGNKEIVEVLIKSGTDVNAKNKDNNDTPLVIAVKYNYKEIVKVLIENGANVKGKMDEHLSIAVLAGFRDITEILIKNGAEINKVSPENVTLLHLAAKKGHIEIVKLLVKIGANVNAKTNNNVTPLFFAAEDGHEDIVEFLLVNGANLNLVSNGGLTPLHIAAVNGHSSVIKVLLDYGANVNIKDDQNRTSLELAVSHGYLPIIKILLQYGKADLNAKGNDDWSILHIAVQGHNLTVLKYLVNEGADIKAKNTSGSQPIHIAAREGFKDAVEYFLNKGCCIHDVGAANQTLLHYAAMKNQLEVMKYLIDQGANINAKDANGSSPLHIASSFGYEDIIKILLKDGAAYNSVDNFDRKPLNVADKTEVFEYLMSTKNFFEAVKNNKISEVKKYIKTGVIVDVKNTEGMTALHFAVWKGHEEMVNILLQNDANPNTFGNKRITPLHYAVKYSHLKIVKILLSYGAIFNAVTDSGKMPEDFSVDESITRLFKILKDTFKNVKSGNCKVIHFLNKIRDIDTIKAVMNACNVQHETLITVAIRYNFRKVEELKNILQEDVSAMVNMGLMLVDQCDYQRALDIFNDVYEKRKSILGSNNPATLEIEHRIAIILYKQGKLNEALYKLEKIYKKQKEILGSNNRDSLSTKSTIALILYRQEKSKEAFEIYQEVYQNQKEVLGAYHPDTLETEFNMALVLNMLGRHEEALNINKKIYKERKQKLGIDNPATLRTQNNIALVLASQGNYEQALEIYQEVLEKKKLILGLYHADTLRTLHSIASIFVKQKKNSKALKIYEDVFQLQKVVLGRNNPETLKTQYHMADVYFIQGKFANALRVYAECFEEIKSVFGHNHIFVSDISQKLEIIKLRFRLDDYDASEILLQMQEDMKTAMKNSDTSAIRRFLKDGMDVNEKDSYGITLLHFAVILEQINIVNILLEYGADVLQVTKECNTALHTAVSKNNKEIVEVLLKHILQNKLREFINIRTISDKISALHIAAENGSLEIIKILLRHGAIYDIENKEGKKPLNLSTNHSVTKLLKQIEELFEHAKNGNEEIFIQLNSVEKNNLLPVMNSRNIQGNTLLQVAIANKHLKIAGKLSEMLKTIRD